MSVEAQRVVVRGRGGPEVLHLEDHRLGDPRPDQVLIEVEAAGVAFGDAMRRRGYLAPPWPFTPGYDVVGVVRGGDRAGQRVGVLLGPWVGFGGYTTHLLAPRRALVPVPEGIEPTIAVALGLNYISAHQLIHRTLGLRAGQRLLVHGAAGGLGTAVLDVARVAGIEVFGTASAPKHPRVRALGGEPIDYRSEDFVAVLRRRCPGGVDAVLDPIGGDHLRRSHATLAPGGTLVTLGFSGDLQRGLWAVLRGQLLAVGLALRPGRRVRAYGIGATPGSTSTTCQEDWATVLQQRADGLLQPVLGCVLPLHRVRDAHRLLDAGAVEGKIVLSTTTSR